MKKYITYFLMAAALIGGATACNEDDLTKETRLQPLFSGWRRGGLSLRTL